MAYAWQYVGGFPTAGFTPAAFPPCAFAGWGKSPTPTPTPPQPPTTLVVYADPTRYLIIS